MTVFNVLFRGTTNASGEITQTIIPPVGMEGPCSVRLVSSFLNGISTACEVRLRWGSAIRSYDTATGGISETLLVNTLEDSTPPAVFRDIPSGPVSVVVQVLAAATGLPVTGTACSFQLAVTPECSC